MDNTHYAQKVKEMITIEQHFEDCRETLSRIPNKSVKLLLQDTPFGVTQNKWDVKPNLSEMWPMWERVAANDAVFIFFATQPFATELIMSNRKLFRYDIIWDKTSPTGHLNANRMPLRVHETLLVFYKRLPVYNPQKTQGHQRKVSTADHKRNCKKTSNYGNHGLTSYDSTERYPTSIIKCPVEAKPFHPTQKPVELIRHLVRTFSNPGDTVFDGYAGAGTTAAACLLEGRNCISSENVKEFYDYSIERISKIKAQPLLQFDQSPQLKVSDINFMDATDSL